MQQDVREARAVRGPAEAQGWRKAWGEAQGGSRTRGGADRRKAGGAGRGGARRGARWGAGRA